MMPSSMVGQSIKIAVAIVGALALMAFIPLMVRGVKASVNTRKEMMAARARGEKPVFNQEALTRSPSRTPSRASRRRWRLPWRSCWASP